MYSLLQYTYVVVGSPQLKSDYCRRDINKRHFCCAGDSIKSGYYCCEELVRCVILPENPARTQVLVKQEEYSRLLMNIVDYLVLRRATS